MLFLIGLYIKGRGIKDLFEENGIEIPTTWEGLREVAAKLTQDTAGDSRQTFTGCVYLWIVIWLLNKHIHSLFIVMGLILSIRRQEHMNLVKRKSRR